MHGYNRAAYLAFAGVPLPAIYTVELIPILDQIL